MSVFIALSCLCLFFILILFSKLFGELADPRAAPSRIAPTAVVLQDIPARLRWTGCRWTVHEVSSPLGRQRKGRGSEGRKPLTRNRELENGKPKAASIKHRQIYKKDGPDAIHDPEKTDEPSSTPLGDFHFSVDQRPSLLRLHPVAQGFVCWFATIS